MSARRGSLGFACLISVLVLVGLDTASATRVRAADDIPADTQDSSDSSDSSAASASSDDSAGRAPQSAPADVDCAYAKSYALEEGAKVAAIIKASFQSDSELASNMRLLAIEQKNITDAVAFGLLRIKQQKFASACATDDAFVQAREDFKKNYVDCFQHVKEAEKRLNAALASYKDPNCDFVRKQGPLWLQARVYLFGATVTREEMPAEPGQQQVSVTTDFHPDTIDHFPSPTNVYGDIQGMLMDQPTSKYVDWVEHVSANRQFWLDACFGKGNTKHAQGAGGQGSEQGAGLSDAQPADQSQPGPDGF